MGSVCVLTLAGYPLDETKGDPSTEWLTLFTPQDFRTQRRLHSARNPLVWGVPDPQYARRRETTYEFHAPVRVIRDRLELLGFTLPRVLADYSANHRAESAFRRELGLPPYPLKRIGPAKALAIAGGLMHRRVLRWRRDSLRNLSDAETHMMADVGPPLGLPFSDWRYLIRGLIEHVQNDDELVLDLSDQVQAGYYPLAVARSMADLTASSGARIIVLTEGRTDTEVLSAAVRLLHPHLADYFVWPDLTVRLMGGTSGVAHTLKSLLSVGVTAPILALFDNDTAGQRAVRELRRLKLPPHVRVQAYPNIESARTWPSQQPSGVQLADLNGLACSLELYFGADVLGVGGARPLVQWNRDKGTGDWHGAIDNKDSLKQRFMDKVKQSSPQRLVGDWADMRILIAALLQPLERPKSKGQAFEE